MVVTIAASKAIQKQTPNMKDRSLRIRRPCVDKTRAAASNMMARRLRLGVPGRGNVRCAKAIPPTRRRNRSFKLSLISALEVNSGARRDTGMF
jgi:hypothetical protein